MKIEPKTLEQFGEFLNARRRYYAYTLEGLAPLVGMDKRTLQKRFQHPETFKLWELAAVSKALHFSLEAISGGTF